eukprot:scaffold22383_cov101-Isochrysis_galbana.AAC.1
MDLCMYLDTISVGGLVSAGHRPMDGRFLLLVLGFAPCPVLPFAREKARQLVSVIVLGVTLATKVPVGP